VSGGLLVGGVVVASGLVVPVVPVGLVGCICPVVDCTRINEVVDAAPVLRFCAGGRSAMVVPTATGIGLDRPWEFPTTGFGGERSLGLPSPPEHPRLQSPRLHRCTASAIRSPPESIRYVKIYSG
jgi:hypothetical protein